MTNTHHIFDYWNKEGLCSKSSPTSHADPFIVKINNYFETRGLSRFIINAPANELALDIGAGYGRFSKVLAAHFKHVVALEGAVKIFAVLEQEMKHFDNVISVCESFEDFGFKSENQFDFILASGILYLYSDEMLNFFFEKVKKNLSPNGMLILRDFVVNGEKISKKSVYVKDGFCYYRNQSFWTVLAERYGMKVQKIVKSIPDITFLRNPIIIKIIKLFHLNKFVIRIIKLDGKYNKFIKIRRSLNKKNVIYTVYIQLKNA